MQKINLKEYNISITDTFSEQTEFENSVKGYSSVFVLTDTNTKKYCLPVVEKYLPHHHVLEIPAGEIEKNIETNIRERRRRRNRE